MEVASVSSMTFHPTLEFGAVGIDVDVADAHSYSSEVGAVGIDVGLGETAVGSLAVEATAAGYDISVVASPLTMMLDLQAPTVPMENASTPPKLHDLLSELFSKTNSATLSRPEVSTAVDFNPLAFILRQNEIINFKRRRDEFVSTQSEAWKLCSVILIFGCCYYCFFKVILGPFQLSLC
jgi:hypothetical protein